MTKCSIEGCNRPHKSRGYCATHYAQLRRGIPVTKTIKSRDMQKPECCSVDGCNEPVKAKGLCKTHYQRLLRHGHVKDRPRIKPFEICEMPGCTNHAYANGLCHPHYLKKRSWADFGLTLDGYQSMLESQGGVCFICKKPEKATDPRSGKVKDLAVDHCHQTNKIRGLLCSNCNRGIGLFCDDPSLLQSAIDYLRKHDGGASIPAKNDAE